MLNCFFFPFFLSYLSVSIISTSFFTSSFSFSFTIALFAFFIFYSFNLRSSSFFAFF